MLEAACSVLVDDIVKYNTDGAILLALVRRAISQHSDLHEAVVWWLDHCRQLPNELAEWKLDQIKQYFDAWDAGERSGHKTLECINLTLERTERMDQ